MARSPRNAAIYRRLDESKTLGKRIDSGTKQVAEDLRRVADSMRRRALAHGEHHRAR